MLSYYSTLKEARFASVAQSVEQLIRNQQVAGSSPATSSTKPVKIERFSPVFSFICSDFQVANLPDPHRDPHGKMSKERRRGCLSYPLRRSLLFYMTCAMKLPIFSAALSCIWRVTWV